YSVSDRLAEEIPGAYKPDQYSNMANPEAHYRLTGPEIWEQTGGEVDAIVISVGTGGTISGVGRFFKERKPEVLIVGADPEGSVYTADEGHPVGPYLVERRAPVPSIHQVLQAKSGEAPALVVIGAHQKVGAAIDLMQEYSISQLPVVRNGEPDSLADVIGALHDRDLLDRVFKNPDALH